MGTSAVRIDGVVRASSVATAVMAVPTAGVTGSRASSRALLADSGLAPPLRPSGAPLARAVPPPPSEVLRDVRAAHGAAAFASAVMLL